MNSKFFDIISLVDELPIDSYKEELIQILLCCNRFNISIPKDIRRLLAKHLKIVRFFAKEIDSHGKIYIGKVSDFVVVDSNDDYTELCYYEQNLLLGKNKFFMYLPNLSEYTLSLYTRNTSIKYYKIVDDKLKTSLFRLKSGLNSKMNIFRRQCVKYSNIEVVLHAKLPLLYIGNQMWIQNLWPARFVEERCVRFNIQNIENEKEIEDAVKVCLQYKLITLNGKITPNSSFYDELGILN